VSFFWILIIEEISYALISLEFPFRNTECSAELAGLQTTNLSLYMIVFKSRSFNSISGSREATRLIWACYLQKYSAIFEGNQFERIWWCRLFLYCEFHFHKIFLYSGGCYKMSRYPTMIAFYLRAHYTVSLFAYWLWSCVVTVLILLTKYWSTSWITC